LQCGQVTVLQSFKGQQQIDIYTQSRRIRLCRDKARRQASTWFAYGHMENLRPRRGLRSHPVTYKPGPELPSQSFSSYF